MTKTKKLHKPLEITKKCDIIINIKNKKTKVRTTKIIKYLKESQRKLRIW